MCGVASRRKSEELVLGGKVKVNGVIVKDLSTKIDPSHDRVFVDGKEAARIHDDIYLILNKPKDTITTASDERGRPTVMELVRSRQRVYPIGRLDRNTTGVLLLTNDGEFAHRLMHPKHEVPKSYKVSCDKAVSRDDLERLKTGVRLEEGVSAPAEVLLIPGSRGREIGITIHEGRNRQVRRMFEMLGYEVLKLDRIAYGPVTHEGLARGATRPLTKGEIRRLKEMAGYGDTGS
jgi:23S rRNA pseudouridine2605 synthase